MKKLIFISAIASVMIGCGGGGKSHHSSSSTAVTSSSSSVAMTSSSSSSASSVVATAWEQVWNDEFDGTAVDEAKWSFERNCTGGGNHELQCYTNRTENASVSDGKLHIIARKESFSGQAKGDDDSDYDVNDTSATREYTSARLRTKGKADWKYGRLEINAKMPQGQGIWPAIWMLPTEWKYGGWPHSGEIDIFEAVNSHTAGNDNKIYGTLHYGLTWPDNSYSNAVYSPTTNIWDEFHTYAIEWEEGEIRWYVDDVHYLTQTKDGWFTQYTQDGKVIITKGAEPFDQKFHLLLNLAVGGDWPQSPNESTVFPQEIVVDYVRVYRCPADASTGKGCASHVDPAVVATTTTAKKEFSLFKNGVSTLAFTVGDRTVNNTLIPNLYDGGHAGNVVSNAALVVGTDTVWDLMFNASPGNAFLSSGDLSSDADVTTGFKFNNMDKLGELKFDMYVDDIADTTTLAVKVDSGWPNLNYINLTGVTKGQWQSFSLPLANFGNNDGQGSVNLGLVTNPFVVEPSNGTAHVKFNNIRWSCIDLRNGYDCGVKPKSKAAPLTASFDVYIDAIDPLFTNSIKTYETSAGHMTVTEVDDSAESRGKVLDATFTDEAGKNSLFWIESSTAKDVTAFATDGYISFDIKVISYGSNTTGLVMKIECGYPCSSGDVPITDSIPVGTWTTITKPISAFTTGGHTLDVTKMMQAIVLFPKWDDQRGVHFQVDNVKWIKP